METPGTLFKKLSKSLFTPLNKLGEHYHLGHFYKFCQYCGGNKTIKNWEVKMYHGQGIVKIQVGIFFFKYNIYLL